MNSFLGVRRYPQLDPSMLHDLLELMASVSSLLLLLSMQLCQLSAMIVRIEASSLPSVYP